MRLLKSNLHLPTGKSLLLSFIPMILPQIPNLMLLHSFLKPHTQIHTHPHLLKISLQTTPYAKEKPHLQFTKSPKATKPQECHAEERQLPPHIGEARSTLPHLKIIIQTPYYV